MKSYFFLPISLFLFLSYSRAQIPEDTESGYTPIDDSQVNSNPQLQGLVLIGVQNVTQQAVQDGSLPEGNYQVSQIISAAQNQDSYRFEVAVTNGQGNNTNILFFITYDPSAGTTKITSSEVLNGEQGEGTTESGETESEEVTVAIEEESEEATEATEEESVEEGAEATEVSGEFEAGEHTKDGFVILDLNVVDTDTEIAGILAVGVQEVTQQAIANGSLYDSPYELAQVYSVQQNIANPNEYRFEVNVRNSLLYTVLMEFDVAYDESNKSVEVLSWGYPNSALPVNEEVITEGIPADYQEISFNMSDKTSFVYWLSYAGLQIAVTTGYMNGTLPYDYFLVTNVNSVSEKFEDGKLYYRFDLDAADDYGDTARFIYVVSYDTSTTAPKLEEFEITDVVRAS